MQTAQGWIAKPLADGAGHTFQGVVDTNPGIAMWTPTARNQHNRKTPRYQSDLTGDEWRAIKPDLTLMFHPAAVRASAVDTPCGAVRATGERRSWSGLRSRAPVAVRDAE